MERSRKVLSAAPSKALAVGSPGGLSVSRGVGSPGGLSVSFGGGIPRRTLGKADFKAVCETF